MNDYIYHHGVKGQKWGIRRYQNPDGSLTAYVGLNVAVVMAAKKILS